MFDEKYPIDGTFADNQVPASLLQLRRKGQLLNPKTIKALSIVKYLEIYLEIGEATVKQLAEDRALHWHAMLSLAVYVAYTPAKRRGRIGELMRKEEAEAPAWPN